MAGEQRWLTQEHIQNQALIRLRRLLSEGMPVPKVHVHVTDLHLSAGNLRRKTYGHALIGLHPDYDCILARGNFRFLTE